MSRLDIPGLLIGNAGVMISNTHKRDVNKDNHTCPKITSVSGFGHTTHRESYFAA